MSKSQPPDEQPKPEPEEQPEPKFSREQYEMLLRCSYAKDITKWNKWRKDFPDEPILLKGADLREAHLEGAHLEKAHLEGAKLFRAELKGGNLFGAHLEDVDLRQANLERADLERANLQAANLRGVHLEGAYLGEAHLEGANLRRAHLKGASFECAHLESAHLQFAHLEGADLREAHLQGADLRQAHLQGADLWEAHLENAELGGAHLEGAALRYAHLEGAKVGSAFVDGSTLIDTPYVNRKTDFTGVRLDAARVESSLKHFLKYNGRRERWHEWYAHGVWPLKIIKHAFVRPFWWMSDYGHSTVRIVWAFLLVALVFADIYYYCGPDYFHVGPEQGLVANLYVTHKGNAVAEELVPVRAIYFSIVTMTTLGFGDMYASENSFWGHILLMVQVLLGYIMLGALVTRFAVLFTAGGPAAKFTSKRKQK